MEEIKKLNSTTRIEEIDLLKAFGIILMIMGHIGFGNIFDVWIHSFHMPMFFIISGFLWKRKHTSFKLFFEKKFFSLLIPYFIFSVFHLMVWIIIQFLTIKYIDFTSVVSAVYHIFLFNTEGMPICGALWFLTALFFVNIFYFSIDKIKNKHLKYIVIILLSLAGCIIPRYFRLPLGIDISLMGVGLFQIGTILKKNVEVFKIETNIYTVFLCVLLGSVICFYNSSINIRNGVYGNIILYYICASLMTIGWYAFFRLFFRWNTLRRIMTYIGKNSIVYLCLNQLLLLPFNKICLLVSHNYILVIVKIIILFLTLVILRIFSFLINKNFKWILGK